MNKTLGQWTELVDLVLRTEGIPEHLIKDIRELILYTTNNGYIDLLAPNLLKLIQKEGINNVARRNET